jgi:hypothetical protein
MPEHYALDEFRAKRFAYRPGHHVAFFGPTQIAGKTTTGFALLDGVASAELPATVLCMKHRDRTVAKFTRRLGFRETPQWPPKPLLKEMGPWGHKPRGYTLWPRQSLTDVEADNARLAAEFRRALVHNRLHTPSVTFADEIYGLMAELELRKLLTAVITRDSGAGHGLWYATQKPSGTQGISMPGFLFNSAEHMFLARDGDERNRARYGEIACGISPSSIEREVLKLEPFSWLYLQRTGPHWAVIDAYDPRLAVLGH